jgi:hypothetical protein
LAHFAKLIAHFSELSGKDRSGLLAEGGMGLLGGFPTLL